MKGLKRHLLGDLRLTPVDDKQPPAIEDAAARVDGVPPKAELLVNTGALLQRLGSLQDAFFADGRRALLLVLQGRDASGKDGTIKTVFGAVNPTGVQVTSFGVPSAVDLKHDFLWRVHQAVPAHGMMGVFNRSQYEDVLVVRVRKLIAEDIWSQRYQQINNFEQLLTQSGVIVLKCFLHVSRDEQRKRLNERLSDATKNWKFRIGDLDDRALWNQYSEAYRDVLTKCSTESAPWFIVPSDSKAVRNYLITRLLVETLSDLKLEYPAIDPDVARRATGFE